MSSSVLRTSHIPSTRTKTAATAEHTTHYYTEVTTIPITATKTPLQIIVSSFFSTKPLLTIFTPPPECSSSPWVSINSTLGTITCARSWPAHCYPESFREVNASPTVSPGIYSPGVCPSGYAIGAKWTLKNDNAQTFICCPPGMFYLQLTGSCFAIITTSADVVISGHTTPYTSPFTAFASTIAVAWASHDLPKFTPSSAPLVQAKQAASTSQSLSTGAKAGIGVGVAIAGIVLLALGIWALFRRKKKRKYEEQPFVDPKPELPGGDAEKKSTILAELGQDRAEVAGVGKPAELDPDVRHELEGDWHGHEAQEIASPVRTSIHANT